jgi:hypothetical protein
MSRAPTARSGLAGRLLPSVYGLAGPPLRLADALEPPGRRDCAPQLTAGDHPGQRTKQFIVAIGAQHSAGDRLVRRPGGPLPALLADEVRHHAATLAAPGAAIARPLPPSAAPPGAIAARRAPARSPWLEAGGCCEVRRTTDGRVGAARICPPRRAAYAQRDRARTARRTPETPHADATVLAK